MKREILFRGKRVDNGEWVEGDFLKSYCVYVGYDSSTVIYDGKRFFEVIPETVVQFSGLCDKNGKRIFEGDIVTFKRMVGNWTGNFITTSHEIIFSTEINAFVMKSVGGYIKLRKHNGYEYEVIGNIHDNPELLSNG